MSASRPRHSRGPAADYNHVQIRVDKFDEDLEVEGLRTQVGRIKQLSYAIDEERKQQSEMINSLESTMQDAQRRLKRAMARMNIAYSQAKSNHLLYLVLFVMGLALFVYVMSKMFYVKRAVVG